MFLYVSRTIEIKRLKGKILIDKLFEKGVTYRSKNLIFRYIEVSENDNILYAGVSVSKRNFNRAVDRNRIKRQLRVALKETEINLTGACMLIYTAKEILETKSIIQETQAIFERRE